MRMVDLIIKKRSGLALTDEEIKFWIDGYVANKIPDYQSAAMQMAIVFKGMNKREVSFLTSCMRDSGEKLDLSALNGIKLDKHSTGGVGDKTSLVLGPMVAACGGVVPKLSGRGLGHTGGTLDKLESIPGLSVNIEKEKLIKQVNDIGLAIAGQTAKLVPADKKMYALRDVTGTVESIPLIAASVMSKKLASGADAILLDVTVGNGAFMKNKKSAVKLAKLMVEIGKTLGKNTKAIISDMSEPLGYAVGNSLEVKEAIKALKGNGPKDLMELCYSAGSIMLLQAGICKTLFQARQKLVEVINNGKAFEKFKLMIARQGGDTSYIDNPDKFEVASNVIEIKSKKDGYVKSIDALTIGLSSMKLGGGRAELNDEIDMSAGILLNKKVGDKVSKNETLCTLYTNKKEFEEIKNDVFNSFCISKHHVKHIKVIKKVIN